MAIIDGYATLADLKARLDITSDDKDAILEQVIEAASRQVDGWCGRPFASGEATRQLTADNSGMVIMPNDLHTISEIAVDRDDDRVYETIWPIESVDLQPYPGPYQVIRPRRGYNFPTALEGGLVSLDELSSASPVWPGGSRVPEAAAWRPWCAPVPSERCSSVVGRLMAAARSAATAAENAKTTEIQILGGFEAISEKVERELEGNRAAVRVPHDADAPLVHLRQRGECVAAVRRHVRQV